MAYSKTTWKNRVVQNPQTYLQQQNADGTVTLIPKEGTITEPGTPVNAVNMNNIENGISTLDAQNSIYNAGGTANAITVATTNGDYSYAQFKRLSIRAATDNTGDVTINVDGKGAVPALKYDKSQIPAGGIKAGKVYDFYYDTVNACFFLIAKASGNAVAADVLAGKTFSNDNGTDLVGALVGIETFSPGDYIIASSNNGSSTRSSSYVKLLELTSKIKGKVRVKFGIRHDVVNQIGYGQIYINDIATGFEESTGSNTTVTFSHDFDINSGDKIQLYCKNDPSNSNITIAEFLSIGVQENPFFD